MSNGPTFITVGAMAHGYQTAPERAGEEPSEGTFSAWMPADTAAGMGNVNHNIIAANIPDRMVIFMVVPSDACTLTSSDLDCPCSGTATATGRRRRMRSVFSDASLPDRPRIDA